MREEVKKSGEVRGGREMNMGTKIGKREICR